MSGATLENAASTPDSARLAEKAKGANPFLGSTVIRGPESVIPIPEGSVVMRLKGGKARFFSEQLPNNGYTKIPEGATRVQFPYYEAHAYNIYYGEPVFYDR